MTPKMEGSKSTLNVLNELLATCQSVTDADIRRAGSRLGAAQKNEKPLGAVHSIEAQRMWATAESYEAMALECALKAQYRADSKEEMGSLKAKAANYTDLEQIARKLFWVEAKTDCGDAAWDADRIGLREGWMLVIATVNAGEALRKVLGLE